MNLEQRVDIMDGHINELKSDVTQLKADVNHLKVDVNQLKGDVNQLKVDVNQLKTDVNGLRVDVTEIKTVIPFLATRAEVAQSRNTIIYWLIGLFIASGIYSHIPLFNSHHNLQTTTMEQS